jgi:molecular chaperone Hsp33
MKDYLYTGRLEKPQVAFSFGVTTALVEEAVLRHDCGPVSAHILGRALTAGLLSASMLGTDERINLRWKYEGLLKTLIVDAGHEGDVRGFISPKDLIAYEAETDEVFGKKGQVTVIRSRDGRVLNDGVSEACFNNVVEDLAFFYCTSEQVETCILVMIGLAPDVTHPVRLCQGLLIQALPDCDLEQFDRLRTNLEQESVRQLLAHPTDADTHFETVINAIAKDVTDAPGITIGRSLEPQFRCTCSHEKMSAVLRTIPEAERGDMIARGEPVVVHCQFCNERFALSPDECARVWQSTE